MNSINGISKVPLIITLIAFVVFTVTMSPLSNLQVIKPVMAAPSFILSKTLKDDAAGHAHGWNPDGEQHSFDISDTDVSTSSFVHLITIEDEHIEAVCDSGWTIHNGQIRISCVSSPSEGDILRYMIINVPTKVVTSLSASSSGPELSPSSPFETFQAGK